MIGSQMISEIKLIYSSFILENIKNEDRRTYYFNLINSIPDNLFDTKNPFELKKRATKASCFLFALNKELRTEGIDLTSLELDLEIMNKRVKKTITGGIL